MQEKFLAYIEQEKLFGRQDKLLCAVSGGVDSMVMIHLLLAGEFEIGIAHVNHHKRGEESDDDEKFIREYAERKGIPFYSYNLPKNRDTNNFQAYAREERYKWFYKLVKQHDYHRILTAHHQNDCFETLFINLLRGCGLAGLSSIPLKNGIVVRPLLEFSKEEIKNYAEKHRIFHKHDSSNDTLDYQRNVIRHKLIPVLKEIDKREFKGLTNTIYNLRSEVNLIEELVKTISNSFIVKENDRISIDLNKVRTFRHSEQLLFFFLKDYGYNMSQVEQILSSKESGSLFETSNYIGTYDRDTFILKDRTFLNTISIDIEEEGEYVFGHKTVILKRISLENVVFGDGQYLGFESSPFPLTLRSWKKGDKIRPLGMKDGNQKLKKVFVDSKISITDKHLIPVLTKGDKVCAVVSIKTSEDFKLKSSTPFIYKLTLKT